jgi:PAS domain S-box-containing protein
MAANSTQESALFESSDVLNVVLKNLAVGVIVCDAQGRFVFFNAEAERILGVGARSVDPAEWSATYGCYLPDMVTPYPSGQLALTLAMRGTEAPHQLVFIKNHRRPAGIWIDVSASPLRDNEGVLSGAVVLISDVSVPENLLRSHAAVEAFLKPDAEGREPGDDGQDLLSDRFALFRTMYQQLARVVEQTGDSILITDKRGIIEYVNPAFEQITGYSAAEVLGRKPGIMKSGEHDAGFYRDLWATLKSGQTFQGTIINRKKSGDLFWSDQTISPIKDQAGQTTHFVSVLKDMTARRRKLEQEYHLAVAREVQQRYYSATAELPGFDIAAAAYPADETGGDYFDFLPQPDGSLYIVVADIVGHGIGSAFVMAEVRASLRAYATVMPDTCSVLACVNRSLVASLGGNRFVTMFLGRIEPNQRSLEYASAGHEPGYLLRASADAPALLGSTAPPLGIFSDQEFSLAPRISLEQGDTLMLLTDGITESMDAEELPFGAEGALNFIGSRQQSSAGELVHGLYLAARAFTGDASQKDDMTALVCKVV